jgi:5-methylcytosine-specific restriction endonuclease McrA
MMGGEIWPRVEAEFSCEHRHSTLRYRINRIGARSYVRQCSRCGDIVEVLNKHQLSPAIQAQALAFDEPKRADWYAKRQARFDALRQEADHDWWRRYYAYLETPAWRAKRKKVLARARGICEGCGERQATQAHHVTYARVGQEMLFDLVAMCEDCHHAIHQKGERHG